MRRSDFPFFGLIVLLVFSCRVDLTSDKEWSEYAQISGIFPHLAYYNQEGECGTGAVVPWAGQLWVITYGPHKPQGSTDKLYQITPDLEQIVRSESIGGTPANRMIHRESSQLFIGPYAIDTSGKVRVVPYSKMPGRHTGNARHLSKPAELIYFGTMEEGFYEVNVNTLEINTLYKDRNQTNKMVSSDSISLPHKVADLPGAHGKGLYSGQGVVVYSNNGESGQTALEQFDIESGSLSEWNGEKWKLIRRNQFVEVTGPGGIYGNEHPDTDPIWVTGWDHKSVIIGARSPDTWSFFRLPKSSHSYDGAHGWNTEWPRIRNIGTEDSPDYLMTMHGMFWKFPGKFGINNSTGIRPRSAYLKVVGDFARWNEKLVFGCDDSAQKEFLNKRKQKGNIEGPGQSNSNLWFNALDKPDRLGPSTASGAVWLNDQVEATEYSESFLFSGWSIRSCWIQHSSSSPVEVVFEVDEDGTGNWVQYKSLFVKPSEPVFIEFGPSDQGEWIRAKPRSQLKQATLSFHYTDSEKRGTNPDPIFQGLTPIEDSASIGGLLYGLGANRRVLGVSTCHFEKDSMRYTGYYELDEKLNLKAKNDPETLGFIQQKFKIPIGVVVVEESSVLVVDDKGRRWRFPLGNQEFTPLTNEGYLRICREVATERDLFNCHGTFYELPAENADGFAKVRPIASHQFRIHDYASYRGLLVMTGLNNADRDNPNPHIIRSEDGKAAVWAGVIDDLWRLGKPRGKGGPWKNSPVEANVPSDPYLIGYYEQKTLKISHNADEPVTFQIEVEPLGHGPWMLYKRLTIQPGMEFLHEFPESLQVRWIRFISDKNCEATAWLEYN